jgi:DnaJ family protein C protein 2
VKRIRKLVDNAYASDPRIARFRKEELEEKAAKKKAKADQAQARRDEEERVRKEAEAEAERKKGAKEEEKRQAANLVKAEKEAQKKALKAERKKLRTLAKENDMYALDNNEKVDNLLEMEKMCELYDSAQLANLCERLTKDASKARDVFIREVNLLNGKMDEERMAEAENAGKTEAEATTSKAGKEWGTDELQLLIKAVKLYPAGTNQRWDVVTNFVNNQNGGEVERTVKETISKAKELQTSNFAMNNLMDEVNKMAYENLQKGE